MVSVLPLVVVIIMGGPPFEKPGAAAAAAVPASLAWLWPITEGKPAVVLANETRPCD
jgi:hypothetical protein